MVNSVLVVNDISLLNPVEVGCIIIPSTLEEILAILRTSKGAVSIGGSRYSMGGQTVHKASLHIDMRGFNKVLAFSAQEKTIRVQAGILWRDIQTYLDQHNLSVKIMQTYCNFTVGGSLSVNVHGRYIGLGPMILSVRSIALVLADGSLVQASPTENSELFYGAIGGYGGLGVIVEAELEVVENTHVERQSIKLPIDTYRGYFQHNIRTNKDIIFHNADMYPPHFSKVNAVSWIRTNKPVTVKQRLIPNNKSYPIHKYFMWAISETPFGKWRREFLLDPVLFSKNKVQYRNYEASYDVAELQPISGKAGTYILQEYFVPVDKFDLFIPKIVEILQRHKVNVFNISIRHAFPDPGSLLAWARTEVFAFVLYYKQRTKAHDRNRVGVWTRELIDAAIDQGGAYYLPYQVHGTPKQFHAAYPNATKLFALKKKVDPAFRFRNVIWDSYYALTLEEIAMSQPKSSEFQAVFSDTEWSDKFYRFLQVIYHLYPEDKFHQRIKESCTKFSTDEEIYADIQKELPAIKPFLADFTYALPALQKQKEEMTRQTLQLLCGKKEINGYLELGSTGRYISMLRKHIRITGSIYLINDIVPTNSPADIMERGGIRKLGQFIPMNDYASISENDIPSESLDVVTCYIGLHHCAPEKLDAFVNSVVRILRKGGVFILRDHDVTTKEMFTFVSLIHTVFNVGLKVDFDTNRKEERHFKPIEFWCNYLDERGLKDSGKHLRQANDPSDNLLVAFIKQ